MKYALTLVSCVALLWTASAGAQEQQPEPKPADTLAEAEQHALTEALSEAGNSPIDFLRALERHLQKYPDSKDRNRIERALVQSSMEIKDDKRIVLYGERVLSRNPKDVPILEKVAAALLTNGDRESAEKAYGYAHTVEQELNESRKQPPPEGVSAYRWQSTNDRRLAEALRLEARAQGNLGKTAEAIELAKRGWEIYPTAAGARERGRWQIADGKIMDAVASYADAFTMEDPDSTEQDRARDRVLMGEVYHKVHHSEKGLGDLILQAYDRTSAMSSERLAKVRENEPNLQAKAVLDFTLPSVNGDPLKLQTLKGKTVVMDFWATWCGPCRVQRPMYQQVEAKYAANPNVIFLSVDTDEDKSKVAPYVVSQKWKNPVYFEAGLSTLLRVTSIPTTIVLDRDGQILSRMAGFIPERFVDMLTARIEESLHQQ